MQKRLKRYSREKKENLPNRRITERSVEIVAAVHRYRFLPTSLIVHLITGNHRITKRHLQNLYHHGYLNRFAFPSVGFPSEFIYYLDDKKGLQLLVNSGHEEETLDFNIVQRNREKQYHLITKAKHSANLQGKLMHISHELMISRFRFLLEKSCEKSDGKVVLAGFYQGSQLWNTVEVSEFIYDDANNRIIEIDQQENLPHRPDAFFALHFPTRDGEDKTDYFFYEADRKTTSVKKHNRKLRAHFHYVVKQKRHREDYGVHRIKAVLIESIESGWADTLRRSARHPAVSGQKPSPLFWFTTSDIFERKTEIIEEGKKIQRPLYLEQPELIFEPIWATPLQKSDEPKFKSIINLQKNEM
jgi:hypothetical protein